MRALVVLVALALLVQSSRSLPPPLDPVVAPPQVGGGGGSGGTSSGGSGGGGTGSTGSGGGGSDGDDNGGGSDGASGSSTTTTTPMPSVSQTPCPIAMPSSGGASSSGAAATAHPTADSTATSNTAPSGSTPSDAPVPTSSTPPSENANVYTVTASPSISSSPSFSSASSQISSTPSFAPSPAPSRSPSPAPSSGPTPFLPTRVPTGTSIPSLKPTSKTFLIPTDPHTQHSFVHSDGLFFYITNTSFSSNLVRASDIDVLRSSIAFESVVPSEAHVTIPGISFPSYPSNAVPSSSSTSSSASAFYLVTFALLSNDTSTLTSYSSNTQATIASGSMQLKLRSQARTSTFSDLLAVVVCSSLDPTSCHDKHFTAIPPSTPDQNAVCTQAQAIEAEGGALWASYSIDTTDDGKVLFSGYLVWLSFLLLAWAFLFLASAISSVAKTTSLCCSSRPSVIGWRGLWSRVVGFGFNTGAAGEEYDIERNVWMQYWLVVGASVLRFAFLAFVLLLTISKQLPSFSCIELSPFYTPTGSMYVEPPVHYLFVYGSYYSAFALIVLVRHQLLEATARSTHTMYPPRPLLWACKALLFACTAVYTCALCTLYGLAILFVDFVPHAEQGFKYETLLRLTSRWGGQFALCVVVLLCECMWFLSAKRLPPPPPAYLDLAQILQSNTEQDDLSEGTTRNESGVAALVPSPLARLTHSTSSAPSTPPPPPSSTIPSNNAVFTALGGPGEPLCAHFSDTHTHVFFVVLCVLSVITSFPTVTTGSWIGGFLLFSIASRVAELCVCVSVCFSIRVRFSSVRARFLSKIRSMSASFRVEGEGDEEQEREQEEDDEEKKEDERDDFFTPTTTSPPPGAGGGGHGGTSAWYSSWLSGKDNNNNNNNNSLDDDANTQQQQNHHRRSFDRPISTSPHTNSPPQDRSTLFANRHLVKTEYSRV